LLLPVLGDSFDPAELTIDNVGAEPVLRYYEHVFPIAPGTGSDGGEPAADVAGRQHYRLVNFRVADTEQNYRRFFAVVSLAGLRVEDPDVFAATHAQIARWVRGDGVDGLRVDHPDGLGDPLDYVTRLRELAGDACWITVEKILEPGETLPVGWPVDGTTGYDALAEVGGLFIDPDGEAPFDELYRSLTDDQRSFAEHVERGKRGATETILQAEIARLARLVPNVINATAALRELVVHFPVYRSYLPVGAEHLAEAITAASAARPDLAETIATLTPRLCDPADELCVRFQQVTGAVMAKGVEDTAYYRYTRFIVLNEVGGNPAQFGLAPDEFHIAQGVRQEVAPHSMTTLSTHDTKRGEDVRARLAVLSELPSEWADVVRGLTKAAPLDDTTFGYLLWQTFAGAGFIARERMHDYAEKAMREAAQSTTWIDPVEAFEKAVHDTIDRAYDDPPVHDPLAAFVARITPYGATNALGQKLVQLTMPGVPDVYQGTELWDDSLVDPDNRRPVDSDLRRTLLDEIDGGADAPAIAADGRAKLWVTSRALRLRRDYPELFASYTPLLARGAAAEHAVAFDRGGAITVATRLPVGLERTGGWGDTVLDVGGAVSDLISGRRWSGELAFAELLADYPVALLVR
jgi:(1->4)-alpha-D-glucan 1-alpha-D-glucosylmutase